MTYTYPTAFASLGSAEDEAIRRVVASRRYTMGAETEALEAELAAEHGRRHAVACNSGSSANLLAVAALTLKDEDPLRPGDRALVPALAWATTYSPIIQHGIPDLVLLDCDRTWNAVDVGIPDTAPVGTYPTGRLVVAASILGVPAHLRYWELVAHQMDAYLLEDNCEALGASTKQGRKTGTYGIASTLSFFYSHQICGFEGGAVLTDDDEIAGLCRLLRNHGNAGWGSDDFERAYDFVLFGYNLRPLELNCAVARTQLARLPELTEARRANLAYFRSLTYALPVELQQEQPDPARSAPFGLAFTVESQEVRTRLVAALRTAGIDARPPTGGSLKLHPYGKPWAAQQTPEADRVHRTGLFLGNAPYPIPELIERAVRVMKEVL